MIKNILMAALLFFPFGVLAEEGHDAHMHPSVEVMHEAHDPMEEPPAAAPTATITASVDLGGAALVAGSDQAISLSLADAKGQPLPMDKLQEVHKSKIHLLIVDESLMDYKHVHPTAGNMPGTYNFIFRPLTTHNYTIWVDVTPVGGKNEVVPVALTGSAPCGAPCVVKNEAFSTDVDGLKFTLDMKGETARAGGMYHPEVTIKDASGKDVTDLQPVMGAYAHIAGFYDDLASLSHMHPMGDEPATDDARGASPLSFMLMPSHEGFLKMFIQIRRGDKDIFAPVGIQVQPADAAPAAPEGTTP